MTARLNLLGLRQKKVSSFNIVTKFDKINSDFKIQIFILENFVRNSNMQKDSYLGEKGLIVYSKYKYTLVVHFGL